MNRIILRNLQSPIINKRCISLPIYHNFINHNMLMNSNRSFTTSFQCLSKKPQNFKISRINLKAVDMYKKTDKALQKNNNKSKIKGNAFERWRTKIEESKLRRKELDFNRKDPSFLTPLARKLLPKSFLYPNRKLLKRQKINRLKKKVQARINYIPEPIKDPEYKFDNVHYFVSPVRSLKFTIGSKSKKPKVAKK